MKVTEVPAQIELLLAAITTLGVTFEVTVMVTFPETAVEAVTQLALLVITQRIISPFAKVVDVYVEPVVALTPFFFH